MQHEDVRADCSFCGRSRAWGAHARNACTHAHAQVPLLLHALRYECDDDGGWSFETRRPPWAELNAGSKTTT